LVLVIFLNINLKFSCEWSLGEGMKIGKIAYLPSFLTPPFKLELGSTTALPLFNFLSFFHYSRKCRPFTGYVKGGKFVRLNLMQTKLSPGPHLAHS
jgi:hypothetical protein